MMRIGLVRHGVTEWNVQKRAQGQQDIALTEVGRRQARALAKRLVGEGWDMLVTSDLQRARETAEIIAEKIGAPIRHCDERLREQSRGRLEGTTLSERIEKWGDGWRELDHGLEDKQALRERGMSCLEEIMEAHPSQNILVVSHGGLIAQLLQTMIKCSSQDELHNTSLSLLEKNGEEWECLLYNCVKHLGVSAEI